MVADRPPIFRYFPRWHLFFPDSVIFTWNLWGGEGKKLRMSHGVTLLYTIWQQNACVQIESHEYENSYSFIYILYNFQIYVLTKDYENMFTLGCRYTSAIKLTTRLLRQSLWPCNLHSTWERKNTLHSYNTSKHICSCSRNSVDNTKLLCNY